MARDNLSDLIQDLEAGLLIDEHALDEALQNQPDLFYQVSKEYQLLLSRRDAAKQEVEEVKAEADVRIRRKARANDEKITEKEIEALVRIDKAVLKAMDDQLHYNKQSGRLGALKEAFQQRGYVLKEMVALYLASYFGDVNQTSSQARYRQADDGSRVRAKMAEERQRRRDN